MHSQFCKCVVSCCCGVLQPSVAAQWPNKVVAARISMLQSETQVLQYQRQFYEAALAQLRATAGYGGMARQRQWQMEAAEREEAAGHSYGDGDGDGDAAAANGTADVLAPADEAVGVASHLCKDKARTNRAAACSAVQMQCVNAAAKHAQSMGHTIVGMMTGSMGGCS